MHRILYFVPSLRPCGPNQQLFYIIKHLNIKKFEPVVLSISKISSEIGESITPNLESMGVKVRSLSLSRFLSFVRGKRHFESALAEINPDLIHSQNLRPDLLCSQVVYDAPKICSVHGMFPKQYKLDHGKFTGELMTMLHTSAINKFDKVVAVSNAVGNNLLQSFHINNIEVIKNGYET